MSDGRSLPSPPAAASPRGLRIGAVSVLIAVAFLLGLALALVLVRRQNARDDAMILPTALPAAQPGAVSPPVPTPDAALLTARQEVLAGQIAALEARSAALSASASAAGGQAVRAEALLTAVAARRALDRGVPLGALDAQLLSRFGQTQPRAVALVRAAAREPVTLEELRQGLDAVGTNAAAGVRQGWIDSLRRELGTLVVLRQVGTTSQLPTDRLARARRLLAAGQVEAARAEVAQLPGADDAAGWLTAARRYVLARQALDALETAALAVPIG
ncbi:MAG: hypothetical protein JWN21_2708 [Sphingomonas bacterium]|uniref:hypothetical protein n=1 Tax=Sphingomonas bacterium TaxID=1895847 RepID=UPI0026291EC9|nr:hypothetical protein [Sphingomonas bacterium]MDB5697165.1 hypothetical protein [Sphingomonas bacterium]